MSESDHIAWLMSRIGSDPRVPIGLGDDTAAVRLPGCGQQPILVTTDMLLEGSCFLLEEAGPWLVGRKALAVNLSDIAAMAGEPVAAVVSLGLPREGGQALAEQLYLGMAAIAEEFNTAIVGGDTNTWEKPLVINVTLLGTPTGRGPVTRSGAEPGDWLMVTGELGGSILGKHLTFTPRVHAAQRLHERCHLKAMIDLSDGLAKDLRELCRASGCGAQIEAARIPVSAAAQAMTDNTSPLDHALGDGEDFELLFAVSAQEGAKLLEEQPLGDMGMHVHRIGEVIPRGLYLIQTNGERAPWPLAGYQHPFR